MSRPFTLEDRTLALKLRDGGLRYKHIALALRRDSNVVAGWLNDGCPIGEPVTPLRPPYTHDDVTTLRLMRENGDTWEAIGAVLGGRAGKTVSAWSSNGCPVGSPNHGGVRRGVGAPAGPRIRARDYHDYGGPIRPDELALVRRAARNGSDALAAACAKLTPVTQAPRRRMTFEEQLEAARNGTMQFVERVDMPSRAATHVYTQASC